MELPAIAQVARLEACGGRMQSGPRAKVATDADDHEVGDETDDVDDDADDCDDDDDDDAGDEDDGARIEGTAGRREEESLFCFLHLKRCR